MADTASGEPVVRLTAWVRGHVQGVGFRWWTRSRALELRLTGYAANHTDGRVCVVAEGTRERTEALLALLRGQEFWPQRPGQVDDVTADWSVPAEGLTGFVER